MSLNRKNEKPYSPPSQKLHALKSDHETISERHLEVMRRHGFVPFVTAPPTSVFVDFDGRGGTSTKRMFFMHMRVSTATIAVHREEMLFDALARGTIEWFEIGIILRLLQIKKRIDMVSSEIMAGPWATIRMNEQHIHIRAQLLMQIDHCTIPISQFETAAGI
mmetsp:Transcript_5266/g.15386  ORF Transcript_5266/g.15386 Transcript_5266/m.15386 type:complete len:163 (-) Transcript_5266:1820-2308(-)